MIGVLICKLRQKSNNVNELNLNQSYTLQSFRGTLPDTSQMKDKLGSLPPIPQHNLQAKYGTSNDDLMSYEEIRHV